MNFAIKRISQGLKQNFSETIITSCHTFSDFIKWYWLLCCVIKSIMVWYPDCLIENSKDHGYAYVIVMGELKAFFLYDSATYISARWSLSWLQSWVCCCSKMICYAHFYQDSSSLNQSLLVSLFFYCFSVFPCTDHIVWDGLRIWYLLCGHT